MRRKAQAAMEFLMTYGWAILVVLAAVGTLAYLGLLDTGNLAREKCALTGDFHCRDYALMGSGITRLSILAARDGVINDIDIISRSGSELSSCEATDLVECDTGSGFAALTGMAVTGGQVYDCRVVCGDNSGSDWPTGTKLDADLKVQYQRSGSSISKTLIGKISNLKVQ